jgi:septum formation protein
MTELILASGSPRRRELLGRLGVPFTVRPAEVDEDALTAAFDGPMADLALHLARHKAAAACARDPTAIIIAADTTVLVDGDSLGKPGDAAEAWAMLRRLRGRDHLVRSGVVVLAPNHAALATAISTRVTMRAYGDDEIARYIVSGDPFDKAGSYAIQHPHFSPVAAIRGCATNVIGLPLGTLATMLRAVGLTCAIPAIGPNGCPWDARCSMGAYGGDDEMAEKVSQD